MASANNNGFQVSWTSIISTMALLFVLAGGGWTLFQSQLAAVREAGSLDRIGLEKLLEATRADLQRREVEIKDQIRAINAELLARRQEFPTQQEMRAIEKRIDQAHEQMLKRIERLEHK